MTAPGAPVLEIRRVSRWFGPVIALNDVSGSVHPGITALVGPNGAGKSTLLNVLTGEVRPNLGEIRVLGEDPWDNPGLFRRVGFCPQQDALFEDLDAPSCVGYLMRLRGFDPAAARSRAEAALAAAGLAPEAWGRRVAGYSKGMRQRVRIAQAIAHSPEVLFLDEPLTGLDPVGRREMRGLFRTLAGQGTTILVSSHVLHEVEGTTDRILLLHQSRLRAEGTIADIRELLDAHPHSLEIVCDRPREMAAHLLGGAGVESVSVLPEGLLVARTRTPKETYAHVVRLAAEGGFAVSRLSSPDDTLEAVFRYLVHG